MKHPPLGRQSYSQYRMVLEWASQREALPSLERVVGTQREVTLMAPIVGMVEAREQLRKAALCRRILADSSTSLLLAKPPSAVF